MLTILKMWDMDRNEYKNIRAAYEESLEKCDIITEYRSFVIGENVTYISPTTYKFRNVHYSMVFSVNYNNVLIP